MWARPFLKSEAPISRKEWVDIEKIKTITTENILFLSKGSQSGAFPIFSPCVLHLNNILLIPDKTGR